MNNKGKAAFGRRAERCEFSIFSTFSLVLRVLPEAHALSLQLDHSWVRRRGSTLHSALVSGKSGMLGTLLPSQA